MSYNYKGGRGGGGYRGGGGGFRGSRGSDWSSRGSGRGGSFNNTRGGSGGGRYFSNSSGPSYDSRSRSTYGAPSDKFTGRSRNDEYHGSAGNYSREVDYGSRDDHRRAASPEPPRKRGRPDSSPSYMGSRRSHERSYSSTGGDYQGRSYVDKSATGGGGYLTEKGSYREVREAKPDYSFRKPMNSFSTRGTGRGGFRGRSNLRASGRWRGSSTVRGRGFKSTTSFLARRRMESLGVRKRMTGRIDYVRRLTQYRQKRGFNQNGPDLQNDFNEKPMNPLPFEPPSLNLLPSFPSQKRFTGTRDRVRKSDDEEDDDDEEEEDDEEIVDEEDEVEDDEEEDVDEEEVEEGDEEEEELEDDEAEVKEDEEMEEGEGEGDGEEDKDIVAVKKDEKESNDEEKKDEEDTGEDKPKEAVPKKKVVVKKKKVVTKKIVKKSATSDEKVKTEENAEDVKDEGEESGGDKVEGDDDAEKVRTNFRGQPFIRLKCPHCTYACVTFREYSRHLTTKKHNFAMRGLSSKLRAKLTAMRVQQRKKQRLLDEEAKDSNLRLKTFYCQVCKLNYRTLKSLHFQSLEHKRMKEFLAPFCRICKEGFKSPWDYENHVSELTHIRRKAKTGGKMKKLKAEDIDLDPSSFMVLDAVGSGDEESEKSETEEAKEGETPKEGETSAEKKKKKKEEIKLGAEHCKLVEVYFCELCKIYLPRLEDKEKVLSYHCRSRTHLERYVRHRDDQSLRRRAVKLHKELEKEKEHLESLKEKEKGLLKAKETDKKKRKDPKSEGVEEDGDGKKDDDKVWSEVDKDLADLLHDEDAVQEGVAPEEAQEDEGNPEEENEEDDDSRQEGERYDRFKLSEKADKEAKAAAAPNGSLTTDEIKKIDPVKEDE